MPQIDGLPKLIAAFFSKLAGAHAADCRTLQDNYASICRALDNRFAHQLACDLTMNYVFGDGIDGNLTFDGTSAVTDKNGNAIANLDAPSKTYTLIRSVYAQDATIDSGVRVKLAGYQFFATGTLTGGGQIDDNGNDGGDASGTTGGAGGAARVSGWYENILAGPSAGSNGQGSSAVLPSPWRLGAAASTGGSGPGSAGSAGASGQGGGGGGCENGTGNVTGGSGGSLTVILNAKAGPIFELLQHGSSMNGLGQVTAMTMSSPGGGGGQGLGSGGGGGGTGAGIAFVAAATIGTLTVRADGGHGGNGASAGTHGGGGGGGGGGGICTVVYNSVTGVLTTSASGGVGGTGGVGLSSTGGNGGSGGAGTVFTFT